jgi:hypothetical protein
MLQRLFTGIILLTMLLSSCAPAAAPQMEVPQKAEAAPNGALTQLETPSSAAAEAMLATMVASAMAPTPSPLAPTATDVPPSPTPAPSATPAPSVAPGSPDPAVNEARPSYRMDVEFSYDQRAAKVIQEIRYTNRSGDAMPVLPLMVELFAYKEMFTITGLWWEDGTQVQNAAREDIQVRIPLREPLKPGEQIGLKMAYEFHLPSQSMVGGERPLPIGYTSRQANLVDWYPFIPPYRSGRGWLAHPPAYYGEHLVYDLADFDVNLRITDERGDLKVAASAPAAEDGDWLRYHREGARSFALSIGHEYVTESQEVEGITVTSYYFPLNAISGKRALQTTVEAVELYSELFGPYPHDTLAVVEADFFDGMEYDGLYFLSRAFYNIHNGTPNDYLVAIAAHETAHQWFYGIIGSDQANEPWLDEAVSTYCERLYYERYYPDVLDWWWYYRINYYKPHGWVNTSVYNPSGTLQTYQDYRNAVYLNGAHFFEDLRGTMGDDDFFAFMKDYAQRFAGQVALSEDFWALLNKHTRADVQAVRRMYFSE